MRGVTTRHTGRRLTAGDSEATLSAFIVPKAHIDFLIAAGLIAATGPGGDPVRWFDVPEDSADDDVHQTGEPWGPGAISWARDHVRKLTVATAGEVGAMLTAENTRSVNHRYAEDDWEEAYVFDSRMRYRRPLEPVVVLKALDCYEYQTCEHPGWPTSEAKRFCDSLRDRMIHLLPGYDVAPAWPYEGANV